MKTITTGNIGYAFEEVIENEIDYGAKWAEMGWFEEDRFEEGHYYYFSNWYGSEGGYYNEETDELTLSYVLDDMEPEEAEKIQDNCEFVEYPINRELSGLHVEYDYNKYKELVEMWGEEHAQEFCARYYSSLPLIIKDDNGLNYKDGSGIYQYINGLFYQVELVNKD